MSLGAGTIVAERFRLVRMLGQGGMGSVWLAQDASLDTPCAVKFILGEAAESAEMRGRFEREAKSAAQLRSPNVVQILDHGISSGVPYIAMEFLEGEDLEQRLCRVGRLSPQATVAIISQVGKALTRAQSAGLVHRDLKPGNIFLVRDEEHDLAKVLDFGVAKSGLPTADSNTKTGALMGTPYYMSPEQTRGTRTLDYRSDLWALAVIVFRCVTGRLPFQSESLGDLLFKIAADPLPVPTAVAPGIPQGFDAWWARASVRDPAGRFQTAREFTDALALSLGVVASGVFSASGAGAVGGQGGQTAGRGPVSGAPVEAWRTPNPASGGFSARPPASGAPVARSGPPSWPPVQGAPMASSSPGTVAMPGAPMASSSPGLIPVGPAGLGVSVQTGVSAHSVAGKPAGGGRTAVVVLAVAGALAAGGALAYALVPRSPAITTPASGNAAPIASAAAPTTSPASAPATAAATALATATASASGSAATPVPAVAPSPSTSTDSTDPPAPPSAAVPSARPGAGPVAKPVRGGRGAGPGKPPPAAGKAAPDDGI